MAVLVNIQTYTNRAYDLFKKRVIFLLITGSALLVGCDKLINEVSDNQILTAAPLSGYTLVWEDDFNVPQLDVERWRYRTDCKGNTCNSLENIVIEDGFLKILGKQEQNGRFTHSGGGIITKQASGYGYYEVRAKLTVGYGWHESFWANGKSGFDDPDPIYGDDLGAFLEIDCFENYGNEPHNIFKYGAINWSEVRRSVGGTRYDAGVDLSADFHTYGFEYTPDYINFYFDGELLKTIDIRLAPQHDIYLWITCISTENNATDNETMYVDYIHAYEITPAEYDIRKIPFVNYLDSLRGPQHSNGTDLWVEAEDFIDVGNWNIIGDIDNSIVLDGFKGSDPSRDSTDLKAITGVVVNEPGTYKLWVRSRDYETQQGRRKFKLIINGEESPVAFGTHGEIGYGWQDGGTFQLEQGINKLEIYDSSQYYAKCDKLLLTTDASFIPEGIGGISNTTHENIE